MLDKVAEAGLQSIQQGNERAAKAATELSTAFQPGSDTDAVKSSIELNAAGREVSIGSKLIRLADDMRQSILDILA